MSKLCLSGMAIPFVFLCLAIGCGGPGKATLIPVTGIVKIDGEPAANIMVQFVPDTLDMKINAPTSNALTDADGKFELVTTKNEKGAIAGPHLVTLVDVNEERPAQGEAPTSRPRLDPKFSSDGIKVEVAEGKEIVIEATGPQ